MFDKRRREFITLLGGAMAWPLTAHAQSTGRLRRVGAILGLVEEDPQNQINIRAFQQGLAAQGFTPGRNVRIDFHGYLGHVAGCCVGARHRCHSRFEAAHADRSGRFYVRAAI